MDFRQRHCDSGSRSVGASSRRRRATGRASVTSSRPLAGPASAARGRRLRTAPVRPTRDRRPDATRPASPARAAVPPARGLRLARRVLDRRSHPLGRPDDMGMDLRLISPPPCACGHSRNDHCREPLPEPAWCHESDDCRSCDACHPVPADGLVQPPPGGSAEVAEPSCPVRRGPSSGPLCGRTGPGSTDSCSAPEPAGMSSSRWPGAGPAAARGRGPIAEAGSAVDSSPCREDAEGVVSRDATPGWGRRDPAATRAGTAAPPGRGRRPRRRGPSTASSRLRRRRGRAPRRRRRAGRPSS